MQNAKADSTAKSYFKVFDRSVPGLQRSPGSLSWLFCQSCRMDVGHIPHVVADLMLFSGLGNVLTGILLVTLGFVPQPHVEVCVEQALVELIRRGLACACG